MSVVRRIDKDNDQDPDKRTIKSDHKESSKSLDKRKYKLMSDIFLIIT